MHGRFQRLKLIRWRTHYDVARVYFHKGVLKIPDRAKSFPLERSEHCEADDPAGYSVRRHLVELHPCPVKHLQRKQGPCSAPERPGVPDTLSKLWPPIFKDNTTRKQKEHTSCLSSGRHQQQHARA